jgi:hypothetical protein
MSNPTIQKLASITPKSIETEAAALTPPPPHTKQMLIFYFFIEKKSNVPMHSTGTTRSNQN